MDNGLVLDNLCECVFEFVCEFWDDFCEFGFNRRWVLYIPNLFERGYYYYDEDSI